MIQATDIDRAIKRRLKVTQRAGKTTVHQTGEVPQVRHIDPYHLVLKDARSGRVLIAPHDAERSYKVGGRRKRMVRTATIIRKDGFTWEETTSPPPGSTIINGLSDKVDNPLRVQRSNKRRNSKGSKGASRVIR